MNRFLHFLIIFVPYLTAEIIQYTLFLVITLINGYVPISDDVMYLLSAVIIIVCGIVYFFWYRYEILGDIRGSVRTLFKVKDILFFVILGIGCQFFFTGLMSIIRPLFTNIFSDYSETVEALTSGNTIVVLLLMTLIAPITEELIFRGVTLHKANRQVAFWKANVLQAILFGIYHWNIVQGVYAALLGLLLGAVYYKYRTIFAPIMLHMLINASSLLVVLIPDIAYGYIIMTAAGAICIITSLLAINPGRMVELKITQEQTWNSQI